MKTSSFVLSETTSKWFFLMYLKTKTRRIRKACGNIPEEFSISWCNFSFFISRFVSLLLIRLFCSHRFSCQMETWWLENQIYLLKEDMQTKRRRRRKKEKKLWLLSSYVMILLRYTFIESDKTKISRDETYALEFANRASQTADQNEIC